MIEVTQEDWLYLVRLADWAAGQGICQIEGLEDPEEWCYRKWEGASEDYSADALAEALSSPGASQEAAIRATKEAAAREADTPIAVSTSRTAPPIQLRDPNFSIGDRIRALSVEQIMKGMGE